MKSLTTKLKITFFFLLTLTISNAQDFQGVATYESKTTVDFDSFGNRGGRQLTEEQKKQFAERLRSSLEKTYTLRFNQAESIYKEEEKLAAPAAGGGFGGRGFGGFANNFNPGDQYKSVKDSKFLQEQEFFGKQFLIDEELAKLDWKIEKETRKIGQYIAIKATAVKKADLDFTAFRPRRGGDNAENENEEQPEEENLITVTAWYTPQIPVNQGPGEYWGLPGLILEVNEGRTTILCSKIVMNPGEKEDIKAPSKGKKVTKAEYTEIVEGRMKEFRDNFRGRGGRGGGGRGGRGGN